MNQKKRGLLILDLDETCIYSREKYLHEGRNYDESISELLLEEDEYILSSSSYDKNVIIMKIRPGLHEFCKRVLEDWDLAIWSASDRGYIEEVVRYAFPEEIQEKFLFKFDKNNCKEKRILEGAMDYSILLTKPLKKVWNMMSKNGFTKDNTLIIDDNPMTFCENYGNAIRIKPFCGEKENDGEFERILAILDKKKTLENVRLPIYNMDIP